MCAPAVAAEAVADTLELTGPDPASLTTAVTRPPAEPSWNVGIGAAQVTVGGVPSILKLALTGVSSSPALSSLAA